MACAYPDPDDTIGIYNKDDDDDQESKLMSIACLYLYA